MASDSFSVASFDAWGVTAVIAAAIALGLAASAVGIPYAVGYALAGAALYGSGIVGSDVFSLLFQLGAVLVLFYVGLEASVTRFKKYGALSGVLAAAHGAIAFALGFLTASLFGFGMLESLAVGFMLSFSSTIISTRFMHDRAILHSSDAQTAYGILIAQDFVAITVIAFFSALSNRPPFEALLAAFALILASSYVVTKAALPAYEFLHNVGQPRKMFLIAIVLGGAAAVVAWLSGVTPLIGAFFVGLALSETPYAQIVRRDAGFMREAFTLLFFASAGAMLVNGFTPFSLALVAALVIANIVLWLVATSLGLPARNALATAILIAPLGELALLAAFFLPSVRSPEIFSSAVAAFLVTAAALPFLAKRIDALANAFTSGYPERGRAFIRGVTRKIVLDQSVVSKALLQHHASSTARATTLNAFIVVVLAYLAVVVEDGALSLGLGGLAFPAFLLLLVLAIIPAYNALLNLRRLASSVSGHLLHNSLPHTASRQRAQEHSTKLYFSAILSALGLVALTVALPYGAIYAAPVIVFLLFSLSLAAIAFDALLDHYDAGGSTLPGASFPVEGKSALAAMMDRERIREKLVSAVRSRDKRTAKSLFTQLSHKEEKLLAAKGTTSRRNLASYFLKRARR
ncbi:hypothetical protein AUJ14_03245 [Candidatus Micrarchaeota archaeon CG1_02_55_22]|nr:MAG: hypothetical protein AUJ14_03245 [Candidatus Micrarchaeota archaeon CG1_02_55_22]